MKRKVINTIRGQVYELLKQAICDGEFEPGQWLQENELAEKLSVSRSPIREALRQLAADGLVVEVPNKGVFVREFTAKDIEEIFDIRVLMENYAIDKINEHLSENECTQLRNCMKQVEMAFSKQDLASYINADTVLHDLLIKLSGNDFLIIAYERIHIMIQQFRSFSLLDNQQRFDESIIEHREIIDHILHHQPEQAKNINSHHLALAKDQIILHLSQKKNHSVNTD